MDLYYKLLLLHAFIKVWTMACFMLLPHFSLFGIFEITGCFFNHKIMEVIRMLQQIVWFAIGYGVAKLTENTDHGKKVKKVAQKTINTVKEEFGKK